MTDNIWYREYLAVAAQLDSVTAERDELRADRFKRVEAEVTANENLEWVDSLKSDLDRERELRLETVEALKASKAALAAERERLFVEQEHHKITYEFLDECTRQRDAALAALRVAKHALRCVWAISRDDEKIRDEAVAAIDAVLKEKGDE